MKEFDKQWQKIAEQMHDAPMFWCEAGWRAALEMILKKIRDKTTPYTQIHTDIEQELGDT